MSSGRLETTHVINEINDLYHDLQKWIRGEIEKEYSIISQRQARDLTVVSSAGKMRTVTQFNASYKSKYGKYPNILLSVDIIRTKRITDKTILVVYLQKTTRDDKKDERLVSAIFKHDSTLKNQSCWIHVHEARVVQ